MQGRLALFPEKEREKNGSETAAFPSGVSEKSGDKVWSKSTLDVLEAHLFFLFSLDFLFVPTRNTTREKVN